MCVYVCMCVCVFVCMYVGECVCMCVSDTADPPVGCDDGHKTHNMLLVCTYSISQTVAGAYLYMHCHF